MIEINLLPEEFRKQQKKSQARQISVSSMSKLPVRRIALITVAAFIGLQLFASMIFFAKKISLKNLDRRLAVLEPKYKVAQTLKLNITQLNNKLAAINELTSKSILWSKKMADLSSAATEGVWLMELSLQDEKEPSKQQALIMKGNAVSYPQGEEAAVIGNFINSLKSNDGFFEDFQDIKLESSQIRKIGELDVMDFTLSCYFKPGRSYYEKSSRFEK